MACGAWQSSLTSTCRVEIWFSTAMNLSSSWAVQWNQLDGVDLDKQLGGVWYHLVNPWKKLIPHWFLEENINKEEILGEVRMGQTR